MYKKLLAIGVTILTLGSLHLLQLNNYTANPGFVFAYGDQIDSMRYIEGDNVA